ncbi:NAD-dependent succinate-semialdehyde dehydrogenase [Granulosicoccus sp. 3-233]|uniref:NAD-dependent succinate-semialdehyde dehydrogenase n=1 Tax=Granulosicoccus sp. 3-233 TaxID=3417969 RepID=UPI003D354EA1
MSGMQSVNPATGKTEQQFDLLDADAIDVALEKSHQAFRQGLSLSLDERAVKMRKAAELLRHEKESLGRLMTQEMGKTLASAMAEVEKCALACDYYARETSTILADRKLVDGDNDSYVRYLPVGPVLAVMPWNFPFWQVFRFAAPALMAGNTGLLKHASNVPRCALAIEDILARAGFPEGAFQTLLISSGQVESILKDDRVRAATVTGSEGAGAAVASSCGQQIKPTVLELGGSDPFIVMPSADIDKAVETAVKARTINNGQSCIAAKRFIVHADIHDDFRDRFVAGFAALVVGDPMDENTDIGPLALPQIRDELHRQVEESVAAGATRLTGARPIDGEGNFYQPGILADIPADSPAATEELFGPVALLFKADSIDDAIHLANDSRFGLGSCIWSNEQAEIDEAINRLQAGSTFVNAMVSSDPARPFGGVKDSGYGRELSADGMLAFMNAKTVLIATE